jgi:thiamine pyrophosphate-dependent acetolactate synthase large subunit-like protein
VLGKQAIIEFFKTNNIEDIFHLPGIHALPLYESLIYENINVFIGRHEANILFMADGYARSSGKIGVIVATPGPGLGNTVSGSMEAYGDDVPLLIIHVNTDTETGKGLLHGLVEPEHMFTHITKQAFRASNVQDMIPALNAARECAMSGRKGPVIVSLPYRLFEKNVTVRPLPSFQPSLPLKGADLSALALDLDVALKNKKKPAIVGGASLMFEEARGLLNKICGTASIPFLTSTGGKGIIREDSAFAFGNLLQKGAVRNILTSADIVIAIGTRLREADSKGRGVKIKELIHADIDDRWIGKNYPVQVEIIGDIKRSLEIVYQALEGKRFEWDLAELKKAQEKEWEALRKVSPGFRTIEMLRRVIPGDTMMVSDLNYLSYWAESYFPVYHQKTFFMPRGISPIFYALPASIGAKIGRPADPCLCVVGDGSALPTLAELATMNKYNIPVTLLVHNNNSFGALEDVMIERYGIAGSMGLKNPDFVKVANAFGIKAKKTTSLDGLRKIFTRDVTWEEPFLIELDQPLLPPPWRVGTK